MFSRLLLLKKVLQRIIMARPTIACRARRNAWDLAEVAALVECGIGDQWPEEGVTPSARLVLPWSDRHGGWLAVASQATPLPRRHTHLVGEGMTKRRNGSVPDDIGYGFSSHDRLLQLVGRHSHPNIGQ